MSPGLRVHGMGILASLCLLGTGERWMRQGFSSGGCSWGWVPRSMIGEADEQRKNYFCFSALWIQSPSLKFLTAWKPRLLEPSCIANQGSFRLLIGLPTLSLDVDLSISSSKVCWDCSVASVLRVWQHRLFWQPCACLNWGSSLRCFL